MRRKSSLFFEPFTRRTLTLERELILFRNPFSHIRLNPIDKREMEERKKKITDPTARAAQEHGFLHVGSVVYLLHYDFSIVLVYLLSDLLFCLFIGPLICLLPRELAYLYLSNCCFINVFFSCLSPCLSPRQLILRLLVYVIVYLFVCLLGVQLFACEIFVCLWKNCVCIGRRTASTGDTHRLYDNNNSSLVLFLNKTVFSHGVYAATGGDCTSSMGFDCSHTQNGM